ncbi:hypothetical protein Psyc_0474 [Psychrobacter arcticus 273-4]|uniref:Uncharacterized protein n=1 Tax=Psychrobacter arcticus (strain DSM 17307 / VKM B-2377 / 273-4) TaxID=259536 RepID=Q4FUH1_PSYA2|nr:hypothetical protein [Psychrobacter arcticus]AAZ18337.1 hypothetical protein Psyc_0474 [Psychrobacter arcticus 273-4]
MSQLISTFQIRFDDETKAEIGELKNKLDEVNKNLSARDSGLWSESKKKSNSRIGQIIAGAISNQIKEMSRPDGLLKTMQADAANDAPHPALKQMGQWVFEGQDEKYQSAAVDGDGRAFLYQYKKSALRLGEAKRYFIDSGCDMHQIDGVFDTTDWQDSAIDRETVNDVDYLSESVPTIQGMEASYIIVDELQSALLSKSVPQITQADMPLIFIKNLSDVLIQRMHSMDRFSEDDYAIGGDKLIAWDIVIDRNAKIGFLTALNEEKTNFTFCFLSQDTWLLQNTVSVSYTASNVRNREVRTITEDQLPAFRAALEACYA